MSWNLVKNIWFWCRENCWKMSRWVIEINTDWSSTAEKHLPVSSNKSGFVSQHPVKIICSIGVHGAGCCSDISKIRFCCHKHGWKTSWRLIRDVRFCCLGLLNALCDPVCVFVLQFILTRPYEEEVEIPYLQRGVEYCVTVTVKTLFNDNSGPSDAHCAFTSPPPSHSRTSRLTVIDDLCCSVVQKQESAAVPLCCWQKEELLLNVNGSSQRFVQLEDPQLDLWSDICCRPPVSVSVVYGLLGAFCALLLLLLLIGSFVCSGQLSVRGLQRRLPTTLVTDPTVCCGSNNHSFIFRLNTLCAPVTPTSTC